MGRGCTRAWRATASSGCKGAASELPSSRTGPAAPPLSHSTMPSVFHCLSAGSREPALHYTAGAGALGSAASGTAAHVHHCCRRPALPRHLFCCFAPAVP